eukprot:SAG11_NODE_2240_length_3647_cov_1.852311_1_plen_860_part_00
MSNAEGDVAETGMRRSRSLPHRLSTSHVSHDVNATSPLKLDNALVSRQQRAPQPAVAKDPQCAICLQNMVKPVELPCTHEFCFDCLANASRSEWRGLESRQQCPLCREKCVLDPRELKQRNIEYRINYANWRKGGAGLTKGGHITHERVYHPTRGQIAKSRPVRSAFREVAPLQRSWTSGQLSDFISSGRETHTEAEDLVATNLTRMEELPTRLLESDLRLESERKQDVKDSSADSDSDASDAQTEAPGKLKQKSAENALTDELKQAIAAQVAASKGGQAPEGAGLAGPLPPRLSELRARFGSDASARVEPLSPALSVSNPMGAALNAPRCSRSTRLRNSLAVMTYELFVVPEKRDAAKAEARSLHAQRRSLTIGAREVQWLQVLAEGWATPLTGFMRHAEFLASLHFSAIRAKHPDGSAESQPLPIVLPCTAEQRHRLDQPHRAAIALVDENGMPLAIVREPEFFYMEKAERAALTWGTTERDHSGVADICAADVGDWMLGGDLEVLDRIRAHDGLDALRMTPAEIREELDKSGADTVFALQLSEPMHNGHVLMLRDSYRTLLERGFQNPALLLLLSGRTDDVCERIDHETLIRHDQAVLAASQSQIGFEQCILRIHPCPLGTDYACDRRKITWFAKGLMLAGADVCSTAPWARLRDPYGQQRALIATTPGLRNLSILMHKPIEYDREKQCMAYFDASQAQKYESLTVDDLRILAIEDTCPPPNYMPTEGWEILRRHLRSRPAEATVFALRRSAPSLVGGMRRRTAKKDSGSNGASSLPRAGDSEFAIDTEDVSKASGANYREDNTTHPDGQTSDSLFPWIQRAFQAAFGAGASDSDLHGHGSPRSLRQRDASWALYM